jgi:hypothetical protein
MADSVNKIRESKSVAERVETLLADIRNLILTARKAAVRSVDILQVMTCFEIGRRIVEHEQQGSVRAKYGKRVLGELSERLVAEFGKGFSKSNLEYMRRFYLMYRDRSPSITQTASGQLGAGFEAQTPGVGRRAGGTAMMPFTAGEADLLRSQSVISKPAGRGGRRSVFMQGRQKNDSEFRGKVWHFIFPGSACSKILFRKGGEKTGWMVSPGT